MINEPLSDHDYISLQIGHAPSRKGPGIWRFNNALLTYPEFLERIKEVKAEVREEFEPQEPGPKWEWLKYRVRKTSIQFSKQLFQREKGHEASLGLSLQKVSERMDKAVHPKEDDVSEYNSLKRELSEIKTN